MMIVVVDKQLNENATKMPLVQKLINRLPKQFSYPV